MQMETTDVIVVGLGAVGSAAVYQLAKAGTRVVGIDQLYPPHAMGSSHGDTRITRTAVAEGLGYVPLVRRSHELWREIEAQTGRELLVQCGGLVMGVPGSTSQHGIDDFATATRAVALASGIAHEVLSADEIRQRFGVFDVTVETGIFEPTAGYLVASSCIEANLELARLGGATLRMGEQVIRWTSSGSTVQVQTDRETYSAASLVIAAGPWVSALLPGLASLFSVQRQVLYWFEVTESYERLRALPVFIWMQGSEPGDYAYGFPAVNGPAGGVKVATETFARATTPTDVDRDVAPEEAKQMYARHVDGRIRGLAPRCVRAEVCLYTVTPDFGFVLDVHPVHSNVVVASPCSGHGFKHSAAVGECIAHLATGSDSPTDLSEFRLSRLQSGYGRNSKDSPT